MSTEKERHGRDDEDGELVFVYRNLHKHCWSIRSARTRLVIGHAETVLLQAASPKVSEAGRQRVLQERRKNVHAGIVGMLLSMGPAPEGMESWTRVTYNPYAGPTFTSGTIPVTGPWAHACLGKTGVFVSSV